MNKIVEGVCILGEFFWVVIQIFYYICENIFNLIIPLKLKSVKDEIVLVTGAGHGIGRELAFGYAALGATVVCWDVNKISNEETVNEIKKRGKTSAYAYQCDVANQEQVLNTADLVRKEVGDVTILINNAGIGISRAFSNFSPDEITRTININLVGHYWTIRAFLPSMIAKDHGHIVALSSALAFLSLPHGTTYCPTKSGVKALMDGVCNEVYAYSNGKSSVKFTTIFPSLVDTGIVKKPIKRFPKCFLMKALPIKTAALAIINAQRRNLDNQAIPGVLFPILLLVNILPRKAVCCLVKFLGIGAHEDD